MGFLLTMVVSIGLGAAFAKWEDHDTQKSVDKSHEMLNKMYPNTVGPKIKIGK